MKPENNYTLKIFHNNSGNSNLSICYADFLQHSAHELLQMDFCMILALDTFTNSIYSRKQKY